MGQFIQNLIGNLAGIGVIGHSQVDNDL